MKSIKSTVLIVIILCLSTLCACKEENFYEVLPFRGRHDHYGSFIGALPEEASNLPVISYEAKGSQCSYLDRTYTEVIPEGTYVNWALDCRYLTAIGKTEDGATIYAAEEDGVPVALLFVGTDIYDLWVGWYVLNDNLDIFNPYGYTFQDFDVTRAGAVEDVRFRDEDVWRYHISSAYTETNAWFFESAEPHTVYLRSKTHKWLVYQLDYMILSDEGYVYIYNLPNNGMLMLTENGEYASKVKDGFLP